MTTHIDALHLRRTLGLKDWHVPQPYGPDGWSLRHKESTGSVFVSCAEFDLGEWIHASIAYRDHHPTYDDLTRLHAGVWKGRGFAYQVFTPDSEHINIHEHALHLWGRLDGKPALPNFSEMAGVRSI